MVSPTVDRRFGLVGNTALKAPVTALADSNITLSGEQTIDGVAVLATNSAGVPDRVLCIAQTNASQNGIWDVSTGSWTRSYDANGNYDLAQGTTVLVNQGTDYAGSYWKISTSGTITIGTTNMTWTRALTAAGTTMSFIQAGTGAVVRTMQDKGRDALSWKDFGAIGDGSLHPLSDRYATLAAAQAVYPFATALTQQIDYAAIQACINAANTLGGAIAYGPPGDYMIATDALEMKKWVTLQGSGKLATVIHYSGTAHAIVRAERVNSSTAVHMAYRDLGVTMSSASATGGCIVDVGGTFVEVLHTALTGGKFGVLFDQTELATIRGNDIEGQTVNGAGIWLVNGPDHTPAVTFTAALLAGATSGTLTGNWTGVTGTYNLEFTETVGGAREFRTATLTNGSTAVTWTGGLSAACDAGTTGASSQFTNRILITENQINNGGQGAVSHIIDDGGVAHEICFNNFNSGRVLATPPACRFAGVLRLTFFSNYMEGGQTMLAFESTGFYSGTGAGGSSAVTVQSNIISMSQPNTPITLAASANPLFLCGNWFGGGSTYKVTGVASNITVIAMANIHTVGTLIDGTPASTLQFDNTGMFVSQLQSKDGTIGYTDGAGGQVTQGAGSKANAVTLNKASGQITMDNSALAAGARVSFTLNNTKIRAPDIPQVAIASGASADSYGLDVTAVTTGACRIQLHNYSTSNLSEAPVLNFSLTRGSTA